MYNEVKIFGKEISTKGKMLKSNGWINNIIIKHHSSLPFTLSIFLNISSITNIGDIKRVDKINGIDTATIVITNR